MSRSVLLVLGFAAAGAVGALAGRLFAPPPEAGDPGASRIARLEERIREIETGAGRFRADVLERLASMPNARIRPAGDPSSPAPETAAAAGDAAPVTEERIAEQVREVVEEETAAREEAMGRRFAAMAEQREAGMLDRLAGQHGLSPFQRAEMEKILTRRREAIGDFFRAMFGRTADGEEVDMTALREEVRKVQEETDRAVKDLLDANQYEAFREDDARMRRGPFFGREGGEEGR